MSAPSSSFTPASIDAEGVLCESKTDSSTLRRRKRRRERRREGGAERALRGDGKPVGKTGVRREGRSNLGGRTEGQRQRRTFEGGRREGLRKEEVKIQRKGREDEIRRGATENFCGTRPQGERKVEANKHTHKKRGTPRLSKKELSLTASNLRSLFLDTTRKTPESAWREMSFLPFFSFSLPLLCFSIFFLLASLWLLLLPLVGRCLCFCVCCSLASPPFQFHRDRLQNAGEKSRTGGKCVCVSKRRRNPTKVKFRMQHKHLSACPLASLSCRLSTRLRDTPNPLFPLSPQMPHFAQEK
ncbi:putative transmembrane protein [Toxoplasma gondii TgCatPRC2]|uniref:Putative transmembrane protein n=1 Tax=Toxoplasma gondii TgCatPRC2 TaxID=1130821 RepID=A0A151HMD7_TOXGO|nr:putative transmembrane protein [Toxoplasma gondii TgCatPRC2]